MGRQNVRQKKSFTNPVCVCIPRQHLLITIAFIAFPEDDRLEYDLHAEEKRHDQIQAILNSESRAAEILARAVRFMDSCQNSMQEALGYSRYGPFSFIPPCIIYWLRVVHKICGVVEGVALAYWITYLLSIFYFVTTFSTMADMMERNALVNAQANASQAEMLVGQATRASPRVQPVGRVDIARGYSHPSHLVFLLLISVFFFFSFHSSLISDVFFDNIFTDMAFHSNYRLHLSFFVF